MIVSFKDEYRWLSNFVECDVIYDGEHYKSTEHAYVAAKTLNKTIRAKIKQLEFAGQAKRFGRKIEIRTDWDNVKLPIMINLLEQKFNQEPYISLLLSTKDRDIIEGNNWGDDYWGMCFNQNTKQFEGENNLGKAIMAIRKELKFALLQEICESVENKLK